MSAPRLTVAERARLERWCDDPAGMRAAAREREAERVSSRRLWAAAMLALDVDLLDSILLGRPVLVRQLDSVALRRALRGQPLPNVDNYFRVRPGHLDAVAEGGAFS